MITEIVVALFGIALGWLAFAKGFGPRFLASRHKAANGVYAFLHNRYYLDWLYENVIVRTVRQTLASAVSSFDRNVVDGFVNDAAAVAAGSGGGLSHLQNGRVQRYAALMLGAVAVVAVILVTT
jgi:NADH:ubiquinone oxidoreductase subunit 5 (subunit L)/multisubunit Na+/H+ antiporter MnhA subunit